MMHKLLNFPNCSTSWLLFLRKSADEGSYYCSFSVSSHVHEFCCHNPPRKSLPTLLMTNHEPFYILLLSWLWFLCLQVTISFNIANLSTYGRCFKCGTIRIKRFWTFSFQSVLCFLHNRLTRLVYKIPNEVL